MKLTLPPKPLHGEIIAPPSKSIALRQLLAAALCGEQMRVRCGAFCEDVAAMLACLRGLGFCVTQEQNETVLAPNGSFSGLLPCGSSAAVFRFLAPVAAALGKSVTFLPDAQLQKRPMAALWQALREHGVTVCETEHGVQLRGALRAGRFLLPGDISSQYASGLLFALPLLERDSMIQFTSPPQSRGYLAMTCACLKLCGIAVKQTENGFWIPGGQVYHKTVFSAPEGDWSSVSVPICAALARGSLTVRGLSFASLQPDSRLARLFGLTPMQGKLCIRQKPLMPFVMDVSECPDLVPALVVAAAAATGVSRLSGVSRLRFKESDRVERILEVVRLLGGTAALENDTLVLTGFGSLRGGCIDAHGDHRIAMLAAGLSVLCTSPVTILGAECVSKSYPQFFETFLEDTL